MKRFLLALLAVGVIGIFASTASAQHGCYRGYGHGHYHYHNPGVYRYNYPSYGGHYHSYNRYGYNPYGYNSYYNRGYYNRGYYQGGNFGIHFRF